MLIGKAQYILEVLSKEYVSYPGNSAWPLVRLLMSNCVKDLRGRGPWLPDHSYTGTNLRESLVANWLLLLRKLLLSFSNNGRLDVLKQRRQETSYFG